MMDTIVKVFTKYDQRYERINVPRMADIVPQELDDDPDIRMAETATYDSYYPVIVEELLEGVVSVHYQKKEKGNEQAVRGSNPGHPD